MNFKNMEILKKKHKVILLDTKEESNITFHGSSLFYGTGKLNPLYKEFKHKHLYIISNDDVKEGSYGFINIGKNGIGKISYDEKHRTWYLTTNDNVHYPFTNKKHIKKIIATTNTLLTLSITEKEYHTLRDYRNKLRDKYDDYSIGYLEAGKLKSEIKIIDDKLSSYENERLPQLSKAFIEKYIKLFNEGNPITEVLVEYETVICDSRYSQTGKFLGYKNKKIEPYPKINSKDNTVTIHPVKDSWNRKEILNDIEQAMIAGLTIGEYRDKWIN